MIKTRTKSTSQEVALFGAETPDDALESKRNENATAILRVFNSYRVFLALVLMLVFLQVPDQEFVGGYAPDLFQTAILVYVCLNVCVSFLCLILSKSIVGRKDFISSVLALDTVLVCTLMYASGGVASGLGNFLVFPVAFAGVLAHGRNSVVIAAGAIILSLYVESNIMMASGLFRPEFLFNVGLLGIVLFVVNLLFQHFAIQLRRKEAEVTSLQTLEQMRIEAEEARSLLQDSNAKFEVLLNSAGDGVLGLDIDGIIMFANPKSSELLKISESALVGNSIAEFAFPDSNEESDATTMFQSSSILHRLDLESRGVASTSQWQRSDGVRFVADYSCEATLDTRGQPTGAVVIFQDATPRRELEERMNHMANFDSLTNLVNRGLFQSTLEGALSSSVHGATKLSVLLLDLDHFKFINDHYGHDYGDALLQQVAERMKSCIRMGDTAARLGGDEFAVLLVDYHHLDNVSLVARNLIEEVSKPYEIKGKQLRISTSIGIAAFSEAQKTPNELLKAADIALYSAKTEGRDTFRLFNEDMRDEAESLQRIQVALQNAVEQNEFKVHYQPIVSFKDRSIHHSEALIRWTPRGEDPISPDIFIPIAEETGRIGEIGGWVIEHVFNQLDSWHQHFEVCPKVSINVSTRQLLTPLFRERIASAFARYAVPPEAIELELTETAVMSDPDAVLAELRALKELGVVISLDDFGTGNSSLEYLRRLPIDQLKIDKCFVQGIGEGQHDEEIIRVILAIAKALELKVVAEGIETEAQFNFLKDSGCDLGQGYLFYRPADAVTLAQRLHGENTAPVATDRNVVVANFPQYSN